MLLPRMTAAAQRRQLDLDYKIGSCCTAIVCHSYCLQFSLLALSLPLAVSTVALAMGLGLIIADAGYNLTGHFSFPVDSNAANGFERLLLAVA